MLPKILCAQFMCTCLRVKMLPEYAPFKSTKKCPTVSKVDTLISPPEVHESYYYFTYP